MKRVHVVDYDPAWPLWFTQLRDTLAPAISDLALAIEHVGSTAVPGLAAKPVIDVDIVIRNLADLPAIIERLATLGYRHRGNLGIPDREVFRAPAASPIPHHLYVCPSGSLPLRNHLALRDHLRTHPEARDAYAALKLRLAQAHPDDMDRYIAGKTTFILAILQQCGIPAAGLAAIAAANQPPGL